MTAPPTANYLFNTPVESGLRSLFVLAAVSPRECDLQRLVIYDYLLVHSDDVPGGPPGLHPQTPLRSGELLVRGQLVKDGLQLLVRKGLAEKRYSPEGICYKATEIANPFLAYLQSHYAERCREISGWIANRFQTLSENELRDYIHDNLGRWGAEFTRESALWDEIA